jgi:hypothetical protein
MSRNQHWTTAQRLLGPISRRVQADLSVDVRADFTTEERDILSVALVHASLAAAPHEVTGEFPQSPVLVGGGEVVVPVSEVKRALARLAEQDSVESTQSSAGMVWRSLFGEVMP